MNRFLRQASVLMLFVAFCSTLNAQEDPVAKKKVEKKSARKQEKKEDQKPVKGYGFKIEKSIEHTSVKNQDKTGTCWCFAGSSFLESELIRMGKGQHNLSEMFTVKNVYKDKAMNYVLRSGKANFGQGALAHDFINTVGRHGIIPQEYFTGLDPGVKSHDHSEMEAVLKAVLEGIVKQKKLTPKWKQAFDKILDVYIGESPSSFNYQGKNYTPQQLAKEFEFNAKDYVNLTSYTHHPFYEDFVLEIPDNNSNGSFHNLPIDELVSVIDHAIENGFSVAWDGDVSEVGFQSRKGMAILPENSRRPDLYDQPGKEKKVTQEMRQETFLSYSTTDDHLMHLVGISRDKSGNKYYVIKNSWGEIGPHKGFLHMSEAYVRLKTVAIMVHKNGVPPKKEQSQ
ncbi:MAG: C1 family peptidase [Planctomycetota bacterium]|nr:C1 family peptidase [Planctomycetota bacterium]